MVSSCECRDKSSGPRKSENFLTSWITVIVSRNTLRHKSNMWIDTIRQNLNTGDSTCISCIVLCLFLSFNDSFFVTYWFLFHAFLAVIISLSYSFLFYLFLILRSFSFFSIFLFFFIPLLSSLLRFYFSLFLCRSMTLSISAWSPSSTAWYVFLCACSSCHVAHAHAVRCTAWWKIATIALNVALFPWNTNHMSFQCSWTAPPPVSPFPPRLGRWSL
jgi:hypothetical protein